MRGKRFTFIKQNDAMQCGIASLAMISTYFGKALSIGTLSHWKSHTNLTHPGKYFRPSKVKIMRPTSPK